LPHASSRSSGRSGPNPLGRTAAALAGLVADGAPALVASLGRTDHGVVPLLLAAVPGDGSLDALIGWRAAPDHDAVAVAVPARAVDRPGDDDVAIAHVVDRRGRSATVRSAAPGPCRHVPTSAVGGRIDDLCRRSLDLPTPAATGPTTCYWAGTLLVALATTRVRCWADVARTANRHLGVTVSVDDPTDLAAALRRLGAGLDWSRIRRAVRDGAHAVPGLDPSAAAWMDDGMFARWSLGALRHAAPLHRVLLDLPPPTASALTAALSACGTVPRR